MMYCQPDLIETQPKGSLATFIRGTTASALPLKFRFGHMEALDRMSAEQAKAVRSDMRAKYAVHISQLGEPEAPGGDEDAAPEPDKTNSKSTAKQEPKSDDPSPDIDIDPSDDW